MVRVFRRTFLRCALLAALAFLLVERAPDGAADDGARPGQAANLERAGLLETEADRLANGGKFREALPLAKESLSLREKALPPESADVIRSLHFVGRLEIDVGEFRAAREHLEREVSIREKVDGPDADATMTAVQWLGVVLKALGDLPAAKKAFERALAYDERTEGPEGRGTGTTLNNLGTVILTMGDYPRARILLERALAIAERDQGPNHPLTATTAGNLGIAFTKMADYDAARPLLERALAIHQRVRGPEHTDTASDLNNLARLLLATGRPEEAVSHFERALAIWEKVRGPEHANTATALVNLAQGLSQLGRYEASRAAIERALAIREKVLGPTHAEVGSALLDLGIDLKNLGQSAAARPLYERGVAILEAAYGPAHPEAAAALGSLAVLLIDLGDLESAQKNLERILAIQEKSSAIGPNHSDTALTRHNLGNLLYRMGKRDAARAQLERVLAIREKVLGPDHPETAASLGALAGLLIAEKRLEAARPLAARSLAIRERVLGSEHPLTGSARRRWAVLCARAGDRDGALRSFQAALQGAQAYLRRELAGTTGPERMALMRSVRDDLDAWLAESPALGASGYEEVLGFKGIVSRFESMERRLARQDGRAWRDRVEDLRSAERRLAALANAVPVAGAMEASAHWREQYAALSTQREGLANALSKDFAPYREALEHAGVGLREIRAALDPGAALVDVLRTRDRYVAWLVLPGADPVRVDLGDAKAVENAAQLFVTACRAKATTLASSAFRDSGKALRDLVLTPLATRLPADLKTLYLSADEALAAVPFAALPGRAAGTSLLDELRIVHLTMAQDLVPEASTARTGNGALLFGAVDYEKSVPVAEDTAPPAEERLDRGRVLSTLDRAPAGGRFGALPATSLEVESLRTRLGEIDATVLTGASATEGRLRALVAGRRFLHLATHGFVREDLMAGLRRADATRADLPGSGERHLAGGHDPTLLCGLALAGANPRSGADGDDGILTAAEASYLDLSACDLVVLSACDTARGTAESGEGVQGLVRALHLAGATSVVGSLWKIDDDATRLLMSRFYDALLRKTNPLSPADALREAALWLREAKPEGRDFSAPRFWAAFVAYGK